MYIRPVEYRHIELSRRIGNSTLTHKETLKEIGDAIVVDSTEGDQERKENGNPTGQENQEGEGQNPAQHNAVNVTV